MRINREAGFSELVARFDPSLNASSNVPTQWALSDSASLKAVETNRPIIIENAQECEEFPGYRHDANLRNYHTVVVLPLGTSDAQGRDMTIAVHSRDRVAVNDLELAFLGTITNLASIAVEKASRMQAERDLTARLRRTFEVSSSLMERELSDGSMEAIIGVIETILPHPLVVADLGAGSFNVRRSPLPELMGEHDWGRFVHRNLGHRITELVREATVTDFRLPRRIEFTLEEKAVALDALVEPLRVNREVVGGLVLFPPVEGLDDVDRIIAQEAKFAINVQLMRDYIRFRSEANSLNDIFRSLFEGSGRNSSDLISRARHHGINLLDPARLIAIGLASEGVDAGMEQRKVGLHLALARSLKELRPGSGVIQDGDHLFIFAPLGNEENSRDFEGFVRRITRIVAANADARTVITESRVCRSPDDYCKARIECARVIALARLFKRTGKLSERDFGPFGVLLSAVDQDTVRDFVKQTLGNIGDYDARHGTELLRTISTFIDEGYRYQSCAQRLGIHVSTLRYRLRRLQELFGVDLEHPDARFGLALALRLRDLSERG